MLEEKPNTINLSWQSIFRLYLPIALVFLIFYFRSIILIAILSFILASLFERPIDYLSLKWKNRWLASFVVYLALLAIFSILIYLGTVILIKNLDEIINLFPNFLKAEEIENTFSKLGQFSAFNLDFNNLKNLSTQIINILESSFGIFSKILGGTFTTFLVILLSFFINTEKNGIEKGLRFLIPWQYEDYVIYLWGKARRKVGDWFFSQIILSLFVGILVYIVLSILGFSKAEFLGLLSGVLDFIPYLGPFIAFIILALITLTQNLFLGLIALISFLVIQIIEGLVAPSLRAKALKMNPIVVILSLLIGAKIAGAIGIIIVLPLAATFVEFLKDLRSGRLESYLPQRRLI